MRRSPLWLLCARPILISFAPTLLAVFWSAPAYADDKQECITTSETAQKERGDRHFSKARALFITCARDVCPGAIRKDCAESIADLDQRTPSVVFRAKDSHGGDLVNVKVSVDGVDVVETLDGKSIAIDPGIHTFHFQTDGEKPVDQKVVIAEGERERSIIVSFGNGTSSSVVDEKRLPVAGIVLGGAGIVAIGVGAVFYVVGLGQRSTDLATPGSCGTTTAACNDEKNSIRTKLLVGDILTGLGIASVITGVALIAVHYASGTKSTKASVLPRFDFAPLPGGGVGSTSFIF